MPVNCVSCGTPGSRNKPAVRCFSCDSEIHLSCLGVQSNVLKNFGDAGGIKWVCSECSSGSATSSYVNIGGKLDKIVSDLASITSQQSEFIKSLNYFGQKIDDFESKLVTFEKVNDRLDGMDVRLGTLERENMRLHQEVNILQQ